jgi:hypothetical protein
VKLKRELMAWYDSHVPDTGWVDCLFCMDRYGFLCHLDLLAELANLGLITNSSS